MEFHYLDFCSSGHTVPPRWRCWAHLDPSECMSQGRSPPTCAGKTEKLAIDLLCAHHEEKILSGAEFTLCCCCDLDSKIKFYRLPVVPAANQSSKVSIGDAIG